MGTLPRLPQPVRLALRPFLLLLLLAPASCVGEHGGWPDRVAPVGGNPVAPDHVRLRGGPVGEVAALGSLAAAGVTVPPDGRGPGYGASSAAGSARFGTPGGVAARVRTVSTCGSPSRRLAVPGWRSAIPPPTSIA